MGNPYPSVKEQYAKGQLLAAAAEFQTENPNAAADLAEYAERHAAKVPDVSSPAKQTPKLTRLTRAEIMSEPFPEWLVFGVMPKAGLAAIAGEPGAGKSFIALEMACAIAGGLPFFGLKTEQRKVSYLVLEGQSGIKARLTAWEMKHGHEYPEQLEIVKGQINLLQNDDRDTVANLTPENGVLIIDTMAQATAGQMDENNSRDMGGLIAACNFIALSKNALVVLVAHVGKDDSKGIRGHSSLYGALDAQVTVKRGQGDGNTRREWSVGKAKDSDDGRRFGFELVPVEVGKLPDGSSVSSCYVTTAELPKAGRPVSKTSPGISEQAASVAIRALKLAMQKEGTETIGKTAWMDAYESIKGKRDYSGLDRAIRALLHAGQIEEPEKGYFNFCETLRNPTPKI